MKKLHLILLAGILMISCNSNQSDITKEGLQGTYDADVSLWLKQMLADDEEMKDNPLALAFAEILISDMKMTLTFENDSLFTEAKGGIIDFAKTFSNEDEDVKKAYMFEIRDDSILYTKEKDKDFEEYGIIRKTNDKYDSLILIMKEEEGKFMQIPIIRRK